MAVTTTGQVAPVGAPSPRRAPIVETVPLPADTRQALSAIVKTMRDVPRAIIGDPAEVVHFLGRTARALERLRDTPVPTPQAPARASSPVPALAVPPRALSVRERAEAVFSTTAAPTTGTTLAAASPPEAVQGMPMTVTASAGGAVPRPRIVMDRKGRGVRVEVRRAREAGQMEMFGQP